MDDPRHLIERLLALNMSQQDIADELAKDGIEVTQATINRIKTGAIKRTGFDIGMGLVKLHQRVSAQ